MIGFEIIDDYTVWKSFMSNIEEYKKYPVSEDEFNETEVTGLYKDGDLKAVIMVLPQTLDQVKRFIGYPKVENSKYIRWLAAIEGEGYGGVLLRHIVGKPDYYVLACTDELVHYYETFGFKWTAYSNSSNYMEKVVTEEVL